MESNTPTVLSQSCEVLYGNQSQEITMALLISRLASMKLRVDKVETSVNTLIKNKKKLRKTYDDTNINLQGLSNFIDGFNEKHDQNVKDVKE